MKLPRITPPKLRAPRLKRPSLPAIPGLDWRAALGSTTGLGANMGETLLSGVGSAFDGVKGTFDTGFGLLRDTVGGIPFLGSTASSDSYDHTRTDEKHYFLIPDRRERDGYALLVLRCLPAGVPPINELPKRRLLHLPGPDALPMLEHIMRRDARERTEAESVPDNAFSNNLNALIDEIDGVDQKVFGGLLAIGGLVALANPLAGAALAANAMIPSVGLIAARYGMKAASRTATNLELSREIRRAEKEVTAQFRSSETVSLVNPLLAQIAAPAPLDMWMVEAERFDFGAKDLALGPDDVRRLAELTLQALADCGAQDQAMDHAMAVAEIITGR